MAPNPRGKPQAKQQGNVTPSQGIPSSEAATGDSAINLQGGSPQTHETRAKDSEMYQDGYFPPTDGVGFAAEIVDAMPEKANECVDAEEKNDGNDRHQNQLITAEDHLKGAAASEHEQEVQQEAEEPEIQIIEPDEQSSGRGFSARGNLKRTAVDNVDGTDAVAHPEKVMQEQGTTPHIASVEIHTRGLHGAAAEAKKGHLMGAAAEAKKGHLMGAAAENVKGNLQGAAAIAHELKLQREASGQPQFNSKSCGFDPRGDFVGAAAQNAKNDVQGASIKSQKVPRVDEDADEPIPLKQAKYEEFSLRAPTDVSAH